MSREEIINIIRQRKGIYAERYAVSRIGVFGSVARNQANDDSDIDIVVEMVPDIINRAELQSELSGLFNKPVDVIRYSGNMNPFLKKIIDAEAVYV